MGKVTNCVNLWSNMNSFWVVHSTEKGLSKCEQGMAFLGEFRPSLSLEHHCYHNDPTNAVALSAGIKARQVLENVGSLLLKLTKLLFLSSI